MTKLDMWRCAHPACGRLNESFIFPTECFCGTPRPVTKEDTHTMTSIDDGNANTTIGYKVTWDNGNHASGEFNDIFFSYATAERFGESWRREMCAIDGIDPDHDEETDTYTFDVIQIVEPKS